MRTFRKLGLVAVIVTGVGMVGSSVAGVANIDAKLETRALEQRRVQAEDVVLEKQRCEERRQRLLERRREQRERRTDFEI